MLSNLLDTVVQTGVIGFFLGLLVVFFGIAIIVCVVWAIGKILKKVEGLTGAEFISRHLKKIIVALACIVLLISIILTVVEAKNSDCPARGTFWMFAGVMCLGEGLVFYLYSFKGKREGFLTLPSIIITCLGVLWLFADIIVNGSFGKVGSGWWVGLLAALVVGVLMYLIARRSNKKKSQESGEAKNEKTEEIVDVQPVEESVPEHVKVAIVAAIYAYYEQQNEKCDFIVRKIRRRS